MSTFDSILDRFRFLEPWEDARTANSPIHRSALPTIFFLSVYALVIKYGTRFMKNRPAYNVDKLVIVYNIVQILFNVFIVYNGIPLMLYYLNYRCTRVVPNLMYPNNIKFQFSCYIFWLKIVDLLDTVFFVLRKKNNQITFLHIFHHSSMPILVWLTLVLVPGGQLTYLAFHNAVVHAVMYTYYLLAALNIDPKYLWWKKHVTQLQLSVVSLPKLPVPALDQTLAKYERTLRPLLTDQQQRHLHALIERFGGDGGIGRKLQLYLEHRRTKLDNWAFTYWLNDMYLANPLSLPINSNPGMVFPPRKFTTILDVARFTARLIDAAMEHKATLDRNELPVECATSREPGQPLCMAQYHRLLAASRLPGKPRDSQNVVGANETNIEHIVVVCRNQFYSIPVKAPDRGRLSEDEICAQLLYVLDDAPCLKKDAPCVGLLTAIKRPDWAEARDALCRDDKNRRNFDIITNSMLIVCLDEALTDEFNCRLQRGGKGHHLESNNRDETNVALQMIHGGGSSYNTANRWFDKTMQIIVSGDGACGLCYEHSQAEGVAVIQLVEKLLKHVESLPHCSEVPSSATSHLPPPERLEWNLEVDDFKRVESAAKYIDEHIKDLDFQVFRYVGYGKEFIKSCKVSPDVYIQLALQLAYYRLYGKLTATYESASTRRFLYGRVDCIRSASPEALAWVQSMAQPKEDEKKVTFHLVSDDVKLRLWGAAVAQQTQEMIDNILGQGIDIHLLGLREAARETSPTAAHPLPELFTDPSYRLANKFQLSTSQVATSGDTFMGYGPVEPDGYGASYNPKSSHIIFCLSAFWSSETTSTSRFAQSLDESLNAMQALLQRRNGVDK